MYVICDPNFVLAALLGTRELRNIHGCLKDDGNCSCRVGILAVQALSTV